MYEILNVDAVKINNVISIAGKKKGIDGSQLKIGSILSDGTNTYEVSGFPFVRYINVEDIKDNICITIKQNDIDINNINGKTLKLIQA